MLEFLFETHEVLGWIVWGVFNVSLLLIGAYLTRNE